MDIHELALEALKDPNVKTVRITKDGTIEIEKKEQPIQLVPIQIQPALPVYPSIPIYPYYPTEYDRTYDILRWTVAGSTTDGVGILSPDLVINN